MIEIIKNETITETITGAITDKVFQNCVFKAPLNLMGAKNIQFIRCEHQNIETGAHYMRLRNRCENILVYGASFARNEGTGEQLAIQVKGSIKNLSIIDNYMLNFTDGVQFTPNPETHADPLGNLDTVLVKGNIIQSFSSYLGLTENGIDIKTGSDDPLKPVQIVNNTICQFAPSSTSSGDAIVIHVVAKNINLQANNIFGCKSKLKLEQLNENGSFVDRGVYMDGVHLDMTGINKTQYFL